MNGAFIITIRPKWAIEAGRADLQNIGASNQVLHIKKCAQLTTDILAIRKCYAAFLVYENSKQTAGSARFEFKIHQLQTFGFNHPSGRLPDLVQHRTIQGKSPPTKNKVGL